MDGNRTIRPCRRSRNSRPGPSGPGPRHPFGERPGGYAAGNCCTAIPNQRFRLTDGGREAAREVVRRHRLWETYLITHADVAPGVVDLSADRIEHVLEPELIRQLEVTLAETTEKTLPPSPHALNVVKGVP
jgi:hypothetical protein